MPDIIKIILWAVGMFAIYGSGLLFWPIHRLRCHEPRERSRVLFWLSVAQLTLYLGCGLWMLHVGLRGGVWVEGLFLVWPLNLLFVLLHCAAFLARSPGDSTEVRHVS